MRFFFLKNLNCLVFNVFAFFYFTKIFQMQRYKKRVAFFETVKKKCFFSNDDYFLQEIPACAWLSVPVSINLTINFPGYS